MPKTVLLPDGTLMAFLHPVSGVMPGRAEACFSHNNGATWSAPETIFPLPDEAGGFGYTEAFIDKKGEVHLFLLCDDNSGAVRPAPANSRTRSYSPYGKLDIWEAHTANNRKTWLPPHRIWEGRAGDMQSVIQLRSGRILLPLSYYVPGDWSNRGTGFDAFTWMGNFRVSALYSDDGGATWTQSPAALKIACAAIGELGGVEPVAIQLTDGRVWMLIRTTLGRFYETFSSDGVQWTPPQPSNIASSDSPAGLLRLKDGRILLFVNDCRRFPYAVGGRQVLHLAVSRDEGRTWQGWREVARDPFRNDPPPPNGDHGASYVYPIQMADGRVLFSMWVETGKKRSLVAFDPKWLAQTTQTTDFSGGIADWSIFGTRGITVTSNGKNAGKTLLMRKTEANWPSVAVWNIPGGATGRLRLRIRLNPGHRDACIGLTDHFSPPFDDQDELYNLYTLHIGASKAPRTVNVPADGKWHNLELSWDVRAQRCRVDVDGKTAAVLQQTRLGGYVNYLRLKCATTDQIDTAGFAVSQVAADVSGRVAR